MLVLLRKPSQVYTRLVVNILFNPIIVGLRLSSAFYELLLFFYFNTQVVKIPGVIIIIITKSQAGKLG